MITILEILKLSINDGFFYGEISVVDNRYYIKKYKNKNYKKYRKNIEKILKIIYN